MPFFSFKMSPIIYGHKDNIFVILNLLPGSKVTFYKQNFNCFLEWHIQFAKSKNYVMTFLIVFTFNSFTIRLIVHVSLCHFSMEYTSIFYLLHDVINT